MTPKSPKWFAATPSTDYIFKALTDGTVTKITAGRIPKMTPAQAAGLVGSWIIETGRAGLDRLDVIEKGSGKGRGLSQYTGVRRGPYDAAVRQAKAAGKDPNSAQWQLEYFAREYMNKDLIGWTRVFENAPKQGSPADYAKYYTGSAQQGTGYFRPGTPHWDRRMQAAMEVYNHYTAPKPAAPKPQAPAPKQDFLDGVLQKLGIKGDSQSYSIESLQKTLAANAPKSDVGFAIFASTNKANPLQKWRRLDKQTQQAYGSAGQQLAITQNTIAKNQLSIRSL